MDNDEVWAKMWKCFFRCLATFLIVLVVCSSIRRHAVNKENDAELACIDAKGNWGPNPGRDTYVCRFNLRGIE